MIRVQSSSSSATTPTQKVTSYMIRITKRYTNRDVEFDEEGAWNWSTNKEEYTFYPVLENHEPE